MEIAVLGVIAIGTVSFAYHFFYQLPYDAQNTCLNHQRWLISNILTYEQDNETVLPSADIAWFVGSKMSPTVYKCPTKGKVRGNTYAYNVNLSDRKLGYFYDPASEVVTMDSKNIRPGFNSITGTSAPRCTGKPAANALLWNKAALPVPNIFYAPGDEEPRHYGKIAASFLDGHVDLTIIIPEADIQWESADKATISYGPSVINNVAEPTVGYRYTQPHVGSAVEGANIQQTHSTMGIIQGKLSWQFSKENVADKKDCAIGFGNINCSNTATALFYFAIGNHGTVRFYQNHLPKDSKTFGMACQIGSAVSYQATDVFSIERNEQFVTFKVNGNTMVAVFNPDKSPGPNGQIADATARMQIFVFTAPTANMHNGVTNVMATGLH